MYRKGKTHFSYFSVMQVSENGKTQVFPPVVTHSWVVGAAVGCGVVGLAVVVCTWVVVVVFTRAGVGASVDDGVSGDWVGGGCVIGPWVGGDVVGGAGAVGAVGLVPGDTVVVG